MSEISPFGSYVISTDSIVADDAVVSFQVPVGNGEKIVDDVIQKQMDQNYSKFNTELDRSAIRHNDTAEFISEQTKTGFMLERQLIGAKAAGQLDRDSLAKSRLDVASVKES